MSTAIRVGSIRTAEGALLSTVTVWRMPASTPETDVDLDVRDDSGAVAVGRVTCIQSDLTRPQEVKVIIALSEPL